MILGTTRVFEEAELARRYPGGRAEYAAAFGAATSRTVADGFALAEDADEMVAVAAAGIPGPGALTTPPREAPGAQRRYASFHRPHGEAP